MRNGESEKLFSPQKKVQQQTTRLAELVQLLAMTPEIRNQSCHPRVALTKALGIYTVSSRKTARIKV